MVWVGLNGYQAEEPAESTDSEVGYQPLRCADGTHLR